MSHNDYEYFPCVTVNSTISENVIEFLFKGKYFLYCHQNFKCLLSLWFLKLKTTRCMNFLLILH